MDDVDNPWILSISTKIYPLSTKIYPDAPGYIHGSPYLRLVNFVEKTPRGNGPASGRGKDS